VTTSFFAITSQEHRMRMLSRSIIIAAAATLGAVAFAGAQPTSQNNAEQVARRWSVERALDSVAIIERKLMIPMRDGVRLATDVYRPKHGDARVPTIFVKTPYNFNYWDVRTAEEFAAGHVRDAINIPLEQLEQRWIELRDRRGERIIVYCRSGRRSALALQLRQGKDFTNVEDGGALNALSAAGVPTEQ
jgi:rhodanese-related sulfurtransferase